MRAVTRTSLAAAALLLAACADARNPLAGPHAPPTPPAAGLASLECRADRVAARVVCGAAGSAGGARGNLVVGGPGSPVSLQPSSAAYSTQGERFTFRARLENRLPQPMSTSDGASADWSGVRVFFHADPAATSVADAGGPSAIRVLADGTGSFTGVDQPYYAYFGSLLGSDGILSPGELSGERVWVLEVPSNVLTFSFTVHVWTTVPHPQGWVEVTPAADTLAPGDTLRLEAVAYSAAGVELPPDGMRWSSGDPTVATVDESGLVTAVAAGTAVVTATHGPRQDSAMIRVEARRRGAYRSLSAMGVNACAVDEHGEAFCWGDTPFGQLGTGEFPQPWALRPVRVLNGPYDTVTVSYATTCALKEGRAWCWGLNNWGALGRGQEFLPCPSPIAGSSYGCSAIPEPVVGGHVFRQLTAGGNEDRSIGPPFPDFACGIEAATGDTWCWGSDTNGELGDGAQYPNSNPTPIRGAVGVRLAFVAAGMDQQCGLDAAGAAFCWGKEQRGELGNDGVHVDVVTRPQPVQGGIAFRHVSPAWAHTCGVSVEGDVYCWGSNGVGQLGTAGPVGECSLDTRYSYPCAAAPLKVASELEFVEVRAGYAHTCALTADGDVWCWGPAVLVGAGPESQVPGARRCSPTSDALCAFTPVRAHSDVKFVQLAAGAGFTCALSAGGDVYCWGRNTFGLAQGSQAVLVPTKINEPAS